MGGVLIDQTASIHLAQQPHLWDQLRFIAGRRRVNCVLVSVFCVVPCGPRSGKQLDSYLIYSGSFQLDWIELGQAKSPRTR